MEKLRGGAPLQAGIHRSLKTWEHCVTDVQMKRKFENYKSTLPYVYLMKG